MFIFLSRFVVVAKILLKLSIMEGVAWLEEEGFIEQFSLQLNSVTKIIGCDKDGLGTNLEEKGIMIIVNLEKDVS